MRVHHESDLKPVVAPDGHYVGWGEFGAKDPRRRGHKQHRP